MKDDIIHYQTMGAIKELTQQINRNMYSPSAKSFEDIIEMAQGIIDIMKKNYPELLEVSK